MITDGQLFNTCVCEMFNKPIDLYNDAGYLVDTFNRLSYMASMIQEGKFQTKGITLKERYEHMEHHVVKEFYGCSS